MYIFLILASDTDLNCIRKNNTPYIIIFNSYSSSKMNYYMLNYENMLYNDFYNIIKNVNLDVLIFDFNEQVCIYNFFIILLISLITKIVLINKYLN